MPDLLRAHKVVMVASLILLLGNVVARAAEDISALVADRTAVEKVYFAHRIGRQGNFEQGMPPATVEALIRSDLDKERVLKKVFRVTIDDAMVQAEVQRINTTTHAPEVLAELKAALSNDVVRFARTVARPLVADRELRRLFDNDAQLHAGERKTMETFRSQILAAKSSGTDLGKLLGMFRQGHTNEVMETSWILTTRPAQTNSAAELQAAEIRKRFGPDAQLVSPIAGNDSGHYIEDMPPDLREVLLVQLKAAGDVSAVIETANGFLLYMADDRTADRLDMVSLALPKRDFDSWFREQCDMLGR